ncbi:uncharacterized protein LOC143034332 [Oratosquilla oratoria]|uniref:uncharacterized protein LOC143034332 n=1 Tax=Oratosquilla oratoria TaxID=337810 RepID=UPI003F770F80
MQEPDRYFLLNQVFLLLAGVACAAPSLYTPEVAAARAEFEAAYAAAALAAEQNALPEVVYQEYTPEVADAREEFLAIYNAAYLAASEAIAEVKEAAVEEEEEEAEVETEAPEAEAELEVAVEEPVEVAVEAAPVQEVVEVVAEEAPLEAPEPVEEVLEVAVEPAPLVAPEPVTDTEEVALAKKEFAAAYEAALAALAANALPEVVHPEGAPVPVEDTAEVTDAKAKFAIAFKAAADAAEAAGDIDLDGSLSRFSGFISPLLTNTYPFGAYGVHAPVVYSAGKVVHAASPLTVKGTSLPFMYPFAPSFTLAKA